jgi:hypothetical protein
MRHAAPPEVGDDGIRAWEQGLTTMLLRGWRSWRAA